MADLNEIRQVAIELQRNIVALKTPVDALKTTIDGIHAVTSAWTLDGLDADLPSGSDVAAQLAAYNAVSTVLTKPANSLDDAITAVQAEAV